MSDSKEMEILTRKMLPAQSICCPVTNHQVDQRSYEYIFDNGNSSIPMSESHKSIEKKTYPVHKRKLSETHQI